MAIAHGIVLVLTVYAAAGVGFAVAFVTLGAGRIDAAARNAPLGFRLLIFPGAAALWPILLIKWTKNRRAHP